MAQIPKTFTVDETIYPVFRQECDKRAISVSKRAISVSKWLRNVMKDQLDKWEVNINIKS